MANNPLTLPTYDVITDNTRNFINKEGIHPVGTSDAINPCAMDWVTQFAFVTSKPAANLLLKTTLVDQNGGIILREIEHLTQVQENIQASKTRIFRSTDEQATGLHDNNQTLNMWGSPYANVTFSYELMGNTDDTGYGVAQIDKVCDRIALMTPSQLSADFEKEIGGVIKDAVGGGTPRPVINYTNTGTDQNLNTPTGNGNSLKVIGEDSKRCWFKLGSRTWYSTWGTDIWYIQNTFNFGPAVFQLYGAPWAYFVGPEHNGEQRLDFGVGGYVDFNYNRDAWYNAFFGSTTDKVVIAQDGSVWKNSIAEGNEVTGPVSQVQYYNRIVAGRWVMRGNGRYTFSGDIYI